jgi:hypothetical protein
MVPVEIGRPSSDDDNASANRARSPANYRLVTSSSTARISGDWSARSGKRRSLGTNRHHRSRPLPMPGASSTNPYYFCKDAFARVPPCTGRWIGPRTTLDVRRFTGPVRRRSGIRSASLRSAITASSRASGCPTQ